MKYRNTRNGKVTTSVEFNEKTKTYLIVFEDGTSTNITAPTLKRWYEQIGGSTEPTPAKKTKKAEVTEPVEPLDDEQLAEVGKEIAEQAKAKAAAHKQAKGVKKAVKTEKKVRKTAAPQAWVDEALKLLFDWVEEKGDEIFVPAKEGMKMRTFKTGGHMYAKLNYSNSSITLAVKSIALDFDKVEKPGKTCKHMFDALYSFTGALSADDKKLIKNLLKYSRDYRAGKNKSKEEK